MAVRRVGGDLLGLGLQTGLGSVAQEDTTPVVTGLTPSAGPTAGGTNVVISGSGFTGATEVDFGNTVSVPFTVVNDGEITVTSPSGGGLVSIIVIGPGDESALSYHDVFTYADAPTIAELFPSTGPTSGGNTVSMTALVSRARRRSRSTGLPPPTSRWSRTTRSPRPCPPAWPARRPSR